MANLSNINNILRISSSGVGLNKDNTGPSELDIESAGADMIDMTRTGLKTYRFAISGSSDFSIFDVAANADRLTINSAGNATFAGTIETTMLNTDVMNNKANTANIIYRTGTNTIVGNNADALVVQDGGNVGIGTDSPDAKLEVLADVAKGVLINRTFSTSSQTLANIRAYYALAITPFRSGTGGLYFTNYDADVPLIQSVNTSDVAQSLLLNPLGGNVGIGETLPDRKLHVNSGTDNANTIFESTDTAVTIRFKDSTGETELECRNDWRFSNNAGADERMRITSAGNVGIGTDSPSNTLHILGASDQQLKIDVASGGTFSTINFTEAGTTKAAIAYKHTTNQIQLPYTSNNFAYVTMMAGGTERVRITSSGNSFFNYQNEAIQSYGSGVYGGKVVIKASGAEGLCLLNNSIGGTSQVAINFTNEFVGNQYNFLARIIAEPEQSWTGTASTRDARLSFFTSENGSAGEKMRITSAGEVLIGTTSSVADVKLRIAQTDNQWPMQIVSDYAYGLSIDTSSGTDGNAGSLQIYPNSGGGFVVRNDSRVGIGTSLPGVKLHIKDSQDSSLYSGLKVERSANTTAAYLNAVGGALNLNTDSSMPLKFRIQNSSMQTINADGGRAYAPNASGLNMKEYGYNFTAANGAVVDLIENSNAHSDIAMVQISITAYHSSRTFFAGMGTFGGYGFHLTGAGSGIGNGGLTSTVTGTGTRKLQWSNTSGYNAVVRLYIQIRTESGITVLNGTLSTL